jgi:SPP1 gp7 family putative phage head morphogenesis protein
LKASRTRDNGERDPNANEKDDAEAELLRILTRRLRAQGRDVLEILGDPPDLNNLTAAFWETEHGKLMADLRPRIERMVMTGIQNAGNYVPIVWDVAVIARDAVDWAASYTYGLVNGLNDNTQRLLRSAVSHWVETPGATIGDLRKELAPAFGEYRAQMIAVTETTRAFAQGNQIVQRELQGAGIRMERRWNTSNDELVCPVCAPNDGKFESEGWTVPEPPAHPNCRCWETLGVPTGVTARPEGEMPRSQLEGLDIEGLERAGLGVSERGFRGPWAAGDVIPEYQGISLDLLEGRRIDPAAIRPGSAEAKVAKAMNMISGSDPQAVILRGMSLRSEEVDRIKQLLQAGDQYTLPLSSFSAREEVAASFANRWKAAGLEGDWRSVIIEARNARAWDFGNNFELVSAGHFRVVNVLEDATEKTVRIALEANP